MPQVSVVIPVHADRDNCRSAVESALAQSLAPLEVVVVDDGSNPPLPCIHDDPRVRQLRNEQCLGPSAARNRGIAEARGDWIAFLDSDDLWHSDKLERQLAGWSGQDDAALTCNVEVAGCGLRRPYNRSAPSGALDRWILVEGGSLQTSGIVLPRALALRFGFDERLRVYEDWDLVLRMARASVPLSYLADCLATYRVAEIPKRADAEWLDRRAAWLSDPGSPASAETRYYHYAVEVARSHLRLRPMAALAVLARLAWQTGKPVRATATVLRTAWRLRSARRRRLAAG